MYDVATCVGLFFQCAVIGIVADSLSSSRMCLSSSSETFAITCLIYLFFFGGCCCFLFWLRLGISISSVIILISSGLFGVKLSGCGDVVGGLVVLQVSGHLCRVIHLSFQSIDGLCCHRHVSPMMASSLPMFAIVNGIFSVCFPMVSFSDAYWLIALALFSVPLTLNSGLGDGRSYVHIQCFVTKSSCIKFAVALLSRRAVVETDQDWSDAICVSWERLVAGL